MSANWIDGPVFVNAQIEQWPLVEPFRISGYLWESLEVLVVTLEAGGHRGCGEAAGVYYRNDRPSLMQAAVKKVAPLIRHGVSRDSLQKLLPPGGARNALDCALWDLEAQRTGQGVSSLAELKATRPLKTTFTCGVDTPQNMATVAANRYREALALKVKLAGDEADRDRICAIRDRRPDVWLGIDANQGLTLSGLENLLPTFVESGVSLIEQPLAVGQEALLEGFQSPIPLAADESVQSSADIASLVGRFDVINIKLDKCGGLTEAFIMARMAQTHGLKVMVGNMLGTSLAMAPAFLLGQLCEIVDLDGPIFLRTDRTPSVSYAQGFIECPQNLWGDPSS